MTEKELLAVLEWCLTIDFVAQSDAMAARFVSWTDKPNSEHVGVFSLESLNQLACAKGAHVPRDGLSFPRGEWSGRGASGKVRV